MCCAAERPDTGRPDRRCRHRGFSVHVFEPRGSVAARRIPAGFRPNCRFRTLRNLNTEGSGAPKFAGADRRARWPALRLSLSRLRTGLPVHNADRRASRRPTAAVSLDPETAFWKRTGAADRRTTPLIPRAFPRVHPLPPARCRTDPCSWAGRCLPRPPEVRLTRPNPQAPPLLRQQAPPVGALCRAGMDGISSRWVTKIKRAKVEICESSEQK